MGAFTLVPAWIEHILAYTAFTRPDITSIGVQIQVQATYAKMWSHYKCRLIYTPVNQTQYEEIVHVSILAAGVEEWGCYITEYKFSIIN
jgi:hypothetical protein